MAKPSNYWDKRAIKRLTDAEKQSEAYIKRIQKIYDRAHKNIQRDIDTIYRNYAKNTGLDVQSLKTLLTKSETQKFWQELQAKGLDKYVKGNYKARISRLEKLQAQIYAKAKEIYPEEQLEQTMCYRGVINDSYYKAIYDTQMGTGLDFAFSNLDDNMVTALLNENWSGKNYSQRIWGNTDILAESLSELVGGAMLSGQSIAKTSRQVRERFGVSKYYAERLVRTETNHFNNEADAMAYEEMDVDKYVFLATLDTRTSDICQSLDNKVFDLKDRQVGVNYPPMHVNCRSKTRAYMGEEIEATLKRRARNPITNENEVIDNMSYSEWAKKHGLDKPTITSGQSVSKKIDNIKQNTGNKPLKNGIKTNIIKDNPFNFKTIDGTHTIQDDLGTDKAPTCNPNLLKGGNYELNCGYSSVTYEMRRRGFNVEANPKDKLRTSEWARMFKGFDPKRPQTDNVLAEMTKEIESWGDGARGIVGGKWKGTENGGHYFSFEVVNGKCVFVCPQTSRYDTAWYFDHIEHTSIVYGRTDNLEPSELIKDACKNKG